MNPVDAFLKHAGFMDVLRSAGRSFTGGFSGASLPEHAQQTILEALSRGVGRSIVPAVGAAALASVGTASAAGIGAITERFSKSRDYKAMLQAHPSLAQVEAGKAQMYFNSLRHVAPSLSRDPLIAGSFIRNMLDSQPDNGPAIPIQTTKLLADAQKSITQAKNSHPIADAFTGGKANFYEDRRLSEPNPVVVGETRYGPQGEPLGSSEKEYSKYPY